MEALKSIPYIFLILAVSGIIAGASLITMSKFEATVEQPCFNASYSLDSTGTFCSNNTNIGATTTPSTLNMSGTYYAIYQSEAGMASVSQQFGTIGIIAVMVIIISLIAGVFVYMQMFR